MDSFYYGIALDYLSVKYTCVGYYNYYGWMPVGTDVKGFGPRVEFGWRWIWPSNNITLRFGFFAEYLFLDISQYGYPLSNVDKIADEDKDIDADSAQMFAGIYEGVRLGMEFSMGLAL